MNQQQKKYTIARLEQIAYKKIKEVEQEDNDKVSALSKASEITAEEALTYIFANKLVPQDIERKSSSCALNNLYDLTPLKDVANARAALLEQIHFEGYSEGNVYVRVDGSLNSMRFKMLSTHLRAERVANKLEEARDAVMLGNDEEAKAAIDAMTAMVA